MARVFFAAVLLLAVITEICSWTPQKLLMLSNRDLRTSTYSRLSSHQPLSTKFYLSQTNDDANKEASFQQIMNQTPKLTLQQRLQLAGQSGLVAYGILNCLYYLSLTAWVWNFYSANNTVTAIQWKSWAWKLKYLYIMKKLGKVSVTVWAGSQATKALRILGAISMAPTIDKVIDSLQRKLSFSSRGKTVSFLIASILGITILFYLSLILGGVIFYKV
jgi:hypothetical protein